MYVVHYFFNPHYPTNVTMDFKHLFISGSHQGIGVMCFVQLCCIQIQEQLDVIQISSQTMV